jgi:hypothetical protein
MAKGKIEQEIALKVTGAKDVKDAAKLIDDLDGETATVKVDVDTAEGVKDVRSFTKLLEGLSDEDKTIVLKARSDQAEREIKKLTGQLGRAKDADAIQIKVTAIGNARAELADIRSEMKKLDGQDVDIEVKATGLDDVVDKLGDLPGALGAATSAIRGLGTVGGIGALAAGGVALASSLADASLEAEVLARLTGDTIQNASRLQAVWQTTGAEANDLADVLLQMNGVFADTPELAKQVGVNLQDGATIGERFVEVVGLVQAGLIDSATQSKIFGEEGVRQVARLTSTYDDLGKAIDEVSDSRTFTPEEREDLERFTASMTELKVAAADVGAEIGDRVVPVLNALFDAITKAQEAVEWLDQRTPEGARAAGLSLSDLFSGPAEIAGDFRHNLEVILGMGPELTAAFSQFPARDLGSVLEADIASSERFADAISDQLPVMIENERQLRSNIEVIQEWAQAQQDAANDAAVSLSDAQQSLDDMGSSFNDMARREGAIEDAFAIGNAPLLAREAVVDVNEAIRDLGEFIRDEGVPNILDENDIDAQPYLQKISSLRGPIQDAVAGAFTTDGKPAAIATANAYIKQVTDSLHGALTTAEVAEMLGRTDITATIDVAVNEESMREAQLLLETFTGLAGQTPWAAEVALALASGELSAQAAQVILDRELGGIGVDVPATLKAPDDASKAAAVEEANVWASTHPVDMQSNVDDPKIRSLIEARQSGQEWATDHPIRWPSQVMPPTNPRFRPFTGLFDQGGTVDGVGGIAGERGPEIINDRYLAVGPTYVPPGTKVTSRRRSAVILRQGRNLRRYDSGGIVGGVSNLTVNVSAAVVGNRHDVTRAVMRAGKDILRLYGTRG